MMKFAILLALFTVYGTFAEPLNPLNIGLHLGHQGAKAGIDAANDGLNVANNVIHDIFGGGHGHKGGVQAGVGGKIGIKISAQANAQIQAIIKLIGRIGADFSSGNFTAALTLIQQLLADIKKLQGSLSGGFGGIFTLIIQFANKLEAAARSKNAAGGNSIIVSIGNLLKQISSGDASTAGAGKLSSTILINKLCY